MIQRQDQMTDQDLRALYQRQLSEGEYLEAEETAKRLLQLIIAKNGVTFERTEALSLLAAAQLASGNADAAAQNYRDAVSMIVGLGDRLSPRLVALLQGLARSQRALGDMQGAQKTYQRAVHVQRVNFGLHNLQQAELVGELVDFLVESGEFDAADGMQTYQLEVLRNNIEETDPRVVEAWNRRGQILSSRGRHVDAQENYVFAADIMREVDGPNSLAQVPLLRSLSASYLNHANADVFTRIEMARVELEKIILILERNPSASATARGVAHIEMGDFMLKFGDWNAALRHYRRAWEHLDADEDAVARRSQHFDGPEVVNLYIEKFPDATGYEEVPLYVSINSRGEVTDVSLIEAGTSEELARRARSVGKKLRFRPAFKDGVPIETDAFRQVVSVPVFASTED